MHSHIWFFNAEYCCQGFSEFPGSTGNLGGGGGGMLEMASKHRYFLRHSISKSCLTFKNPEITFKT